MDDLVQVLAKFHREVLLPDVERIVGNAVEGAERRLRDEMHTLFDHLSQQIDELHWYEAHGIGKKELKVKRYLD